MAIKKSNLLLPIIAVILLAFLSFNSVQAASPVEDGFYIDGASKKHFYTLEELMLNMDEVFAIINEAGLDKTYYVQDESLIDLEALFNSSDFVPYKDGMIPAGTYVGSTGNQLINGGNVATEFYVESIE